MAVSVAVAQLLVSTVLLVAATGKFLSRADFERTLRGSRFPRRLTPAAVHAVPLVELTLAVSIVTTASSPVPLAVTAVFLLGLTAWLLDVLRRGVSVPCACFGGSREPVTPKAVARNAVLVVVSAAGAAGAAGSGTALPAPDRWTAPTMLALGLVAVLATAARANITYLTLRFSHEDQEGGGA